MCCAMVRDAAARSITAMCTKGCGSPMVKVSDYGKHVMSLSPVSLKTCRVGQRSMLNLSRAQTSFSWCGVVVRCRPRHLTVVKKLPDPSVKALV
ncbi:hypothetical protein TNCV_2378491 [Trichonephila clavipes]|nr:hypothetical protein TNCV_2378491 [Trichonephila clavipes]